MGIENSSATGHKDAASEQYQVNIVNGSSTIPLGTFQSFELATVAGDSARNGMLLMSSWETVRRVHFNITVIV